MKKTLSMLLAGAMLAAALTGCGSSASTGSDNADSSTDSSASGAAFKLGGTGPLTGANAIYGNACKNGAQIAVDEINAEGGDIQFELNYQDDEGDAEKAVNAYNTLKDWGMQLSLGSVTSKPCEATAAETYSDRIFALTPSASSTGTTEGKDNMFQMCFIDPAQGTLAADKIAEKKLGTKIAIIWKNDDVYSTGIHDKFVEEAKTKGLEVVSDMTFTDSSANDFSVQLNDAKSKGAELVFLPIYYQPASLILTQAHDMGFQTTFFGVDGMDGILTLEGFDTSLAEGLMLMTPFNANSTDEKTASFVKKYQEQFGETPNQFASRGGRSLTLNVPKPTSATLSPATRASLMAATVASSAFFESAFDKPEPAYSVELFLQFLQTHTCSSILVSEINHFGSSPFSLMNFPMV